MNKNLGKFIVNDCVFADHGTETVVKEIKDITFYFEGKSIINIAQVYSLNLLENNCIYVRAALFSPVLYNAYIQNYTIDKIIETGICVNPIDIDKQSIYQVEYYNYKFKEFTFLRAENEYSFILQPTNKFNDTND